LPWGIFAVVLLIIALGLSLWNYHRRERERLGHQSKTAAVLSPQQSPATSAVPVQASPLQTAAQTTSQVQEPGQQSQPASSGSSTASASPQASTSSPSTPSDSRTAGEFSVVLRAMGESWVSPVVDGKPSGQETLHTGDVRSFHAHDRVILKAGNASSLAITLNGSPIPMEGEPGQVKTITLGPEGIVPPALQQLPPASH
jgi:hypothetical protein